MNSENINQNEESSTSQRLEILKDLKNGIKPTPLFALKKYGSLRLSGRINELRSQGHKIRTDMVIENGKRVAQYTYIGYIGD